MTKAKQPINTTKSKLSTVLPIIFGLMFVVSVGMNLGADYLYRNADIGGNLQYGGLFFGFGMFAAVTVIIGSGAVFIVKTLPAKLGAVIAVVLAAMMTYSLMILSVSTNLL